MPHVTVSASATGSGTLTKPSGLVSDLWTVTDAVTTSGSAVVTSASNGFATAAAGQAITIQGAGTGGLSLNSTIASKQNNGQITLANNAVTSQAGGVYALGGTNNDTVIQASIATGSTNLWLPARTLWMPASNFVPAGLVIQGADRQTVVIRTSDPSNAPNLSIGAGTSFYNVAFYDVFSFQIPYTWNGGPLTNNVAGIRPARVFINSSTANYVPSNYPEQGLTIVTGNSSNPTEDRPGITVTQNSIGGGFYAQVRADQAGGFHAQVNQGQAAMTGRGVLVWTYGAGAGVEAQAQVGASGPLFKAIASANVRSIEIVPTIDTARDIHIQTATKTTGQVIYVNQITSTFTGQVIMVDVASSFAGQFILLRVNSANVFRVSAGGQLLATTTVKAGLPTTTDIPTGQWAIYKDSSGGSLRLWANDGGTLKSVTLA